MNDSFDRKEQVLTTKIHHYATRTELSYDGFRKKLKGVLRDNVQRFNLDANFVRKINTNKVFQ